MKFGHFINNIRREMSQDMRLKLSTRDGNKEDAIEIIQGHKIPNTVTYRFKLEDHTVGDLLRIFLLKNQQVKFAGYKVPHPLEDILEVKLQTNTIKPNEVVGSTLKLLQKDLLELESEFDEAVRTRAMGGH